MKPNQFKIDSPMSRRSALKFGGGVAAAASVSATFGGFSSRVFAQDQAPHFFLEVTVPGGFDASYLLDARPLSMMAAGKKVIHQSATPTVWEGKNGVSCLAAATPSAALLGVKDDITVINGVLMATGFDGHDQNANFFATGNPFGGEYFVPHFNQTGVRTPLDFISTGFFQDTEITNGANGVPLNAFSGKQLADRLRMMAPMNSESKLSRQIRSRMELVGRGTGKFAAGSRALLSGFDRAPELDGVLRKVNPDTTTTSFAMQSMSIVGEMFRNHGARAAKVQIFPRKDDQSFTVDSHGAEDTKKYEELATLVAEDIAAIVKYLKETEYRNGQSLWDVTTLVFGSEFGRTLRQKDIEIQSSGTDHNPLSNMLIVGGKGIAGGNVLGGSDSRDEVEVVSGAHLSLDTDHLKAMGLPFDFATGRVRADLPEVFDPADYVTMGSVVNSLYGIFGVAESKHWLTQRNGVKAKALKLS